MQTAKLQHLPHSSSAQRDFSVHSIEIQEWQSLSRLLPATAIADLARNQTNALSVQLLPNGMTKLTAGPFVGRLRLGSIDLLLKPKTPIASLLTLLAEVYELVRLIPNFVGFQETPEIVDLLINVFLKQVDYLTQCGLKRTYVNCEDELVAVRGRIDVRRTSALQMQAKPKVWCSFDEFTLDNIENQVLLATLRAIAANPTISSRRRRSAQKITAEFLGVSDVEVQPNRIATIACDRLMSHYEPALRLARLILASMGVANNFGDLPSSGFLLNMNDLFEQFVYRRLSALSSPYGITVRRQLTLPFDEQGQATIRPDLVIQSKCGRRLVADTKYKAVSKPEPADLYQMLAYCRVMQVENGFLIMAGKRLPATYSICDGQTKIDVVSVDLDGSTANVDHSLQFVAKQIRERLAIIAG
jgi:5-methylcytosine-specific restriction enzyme subunit McrC